MDDTISRKVALDALKNSRFPGAPYVDAGISIAIGVICDLPPIDAVPVVRCKDCKHRSLENNVWACPFGLPGGPEFFCSYGMDGKDGNDHG